MSMEIPVVRIQLEGMKISLLAHLATQHEAIERAVARAIDSFDMEREIDSVVRSELPTLLRQAIRDIARDALYDNEFRSHMKTVVLSVLNETLEEKS